MIGVARQSRILQVCPFLARHPFPPLAAKVATISVAQVLPIHLVFRSRMLNSTLHDNYSLAHHRKFCHRFRHELLEARAKAPYQHEGDHKEKAEKFSWEDFASVSPPLVTSTPPTLNATLHGKEYCKWRADKMEIETDVIAAEPKKPRLVSLRANMSSVLIMFSVMVVMSAKPARPPIARASIQSGDERQETSRSPFSLV